MKNCLRGLAVGAASAALVVAASGTAHAASHGASCSSAGAGGTASGTTYYHNSSGYDYIDYWVYQINSRPGTTQNNARFIQYHAITALPDQPINTFNTADNKVTGVTYTSYPSSTIKIANSWATYTNFTFYFDKDNGVDESCSVNTVQW